MNGESLPNSNHERIRDRIVSPHAEAILKIFQKYQEENNINLDKETVKDLLYTFVEHAVEHTQIHTSEKYGVAFPYTAIHTAELAKQLFSHARTFPEQDSVSAETKPEKHTKEFVFGSFINTQNGHQFTFFEEALHQVVTGLPRALEEIQNGQEPDDNEVYVLGSPTNELGTMSPQFLASLDKDNTFKQFGGMYAEFVASQLPQDEQERDATNVYLYGISMGGSFATQTAEQLLAQGAIAQSHEEAQEKHIPFAQVRADTLPGASESTLRRWQIPIGFGVDSVITMAKDPYTRTAVLKEGKSAGQINAVLAERGIVVNMPPEQKDMKEKAISNVIENLRNGIPVDPNLKLTEVRGVYDPLMYSGSFRKEVSEHREEHEGSLGEKFVSPTENRRTVGVDMAHTMVFFRDNELKRLARAASALEALKQP